MTLEDQITQASKACLDYLTLANYEYNRQSFPDVSPARWTLVYGIQQVEWMEKMLQAKKSLTIDV